MEINGESKNILAHFNSIAMYWYLWSFQFVPPFPQEHSQKRQFNPRRKIRWIAQCYPQYLKTKISFHFHFPTSNHLPFCTIENKIAHGLDLLGVWFKQLYGISPHRKYICMPLLQIKISFPNERLGEKSSLPIKTCLYSWRADSENVMEAECGSPQVWPGAAVLRERRPKPDLQTSRGARLSLCPRVSASISFSSARRARALSTPPSLHLPGHKPLSSAWVSSRGSVLSHVDWSEPKGARPSCATYSRSSRPLPASPSLFEHLQSLWLARVWVAHCG